MKNKKDYAIEEAELIVEDYINKSAQRLRNNLRAAWKKSKSQTKAKTIYAKNQI